MTARNGHEGGVRYEKDEVSAGAVARFGVVLVAVTLATALVLLPVFGWLKARETRRDPPAPPLGRHEPGRLPPEPRLQTSPVKDLAAVRAAQQERLGSYGWVDEEKGVVHVPIERAMELMLAREAAPDRPTGAAAAPPSPQASPAGDRP